MSDEKRGSGFTTYRSHLNFLHHVEEFSKEKQYVVLFLFVIALEVVAEYLTNQVF